MEMEKKIIISQQQISVLGKIISPKEVSINQAKISAVMESPTNKMVKDLQKVSVDCKY